MVETTIINNMVACADEHACLLRTRRAWDVRVEPRIKSGRHARRNRKRSVYFWASPDIDRVQQQIGEILAGEGFNVVAERHLGLSENFAFGEVAPHQVEDMIRATAKAAPQAILVMCTNLLAAPLVEALERELGAPILDSVASAVWGSSRIAGVDPSGVTRWALLFDMPQTRR